jgi:hypothetical protein
VVGGRRGKRAKKQGNGQKSEEAGERAVRNGVGGRREVVGRKGQKRGWSRKGRRAGL